MGVQRVSGYTRQTASGPVHVEAYSRETVDKARKRLQDRMQGEVSVASELTKEQLDAPLSEVFRLLREERKAAKAERARLRALRKRMRDRGPLRTDLLGPDGW